MGCRRRAFCTQTKRRRSLQGDVTRESAHELLCVKEVPRGHFLHDTHRRACLTVRFSLVSVFFMRYVCYTSILFLFANDNLYMHACVTFLKLHTACACPPIIAHLILHASFLLATQKSKALFGYAKEHVHRLVG